MRYCELLPHRCPVECTSATFVVDVHGINKTHSLAEYDVRIAQKVPCLPPVQSSKVQRGRIDATPHVGCNVPRPGHRFALRSCPATDTSYEWANSPLLEIAYYVSCMRAHLLLLTHLTCALANTYYLSVCTQIYHRAVHKCTLPLVVCPRVHMLLWLCTSTHHLTWMCVCRYDYKICLLYEVYKDY